MFRSIENDGFIDEIANKVIEVTEKHIQEDDVLRNAFNDGNSISISEKEFKGVLKRALKTNGYVRTSNNMIALSDKVINLFVNKGYGVGITNEGIFLRKCDIET